MINLDVSTAASVKMVQRTPVDTEYERAFWGILAVLGKPESYIDVYSATAWMARCARMAQISPSRCIVPTRNRKNEAGKYAHAFIAANFGGEPFEPLRQFELVTCFGCVISTVQFIENLSSLTEKWLVVASLQTPRYRIEQFQASGLCYDHEMTEKLHCALDGIRSAYWKPSSAIVLRKIA